MQQITIDSKIPLSKEYIGCKINLSVAGLKDDGIAEPILNIDGNLSLSGITEETTVYGTTTTLWLG